MAIEYVQNVTIKADKGRATVILDVEGYISEANYQLKNNLFHQRLYEDSTTLKV